MIYIHLLYHNNHLFRCKTVVLNLIRYINDIYSPSAEQIVGEVFFSFFSLRGVQVIKAALTASYHPECQDSRVQAPEASSAFPVADITRSIWPPFGWLSLPLGTRASLSRRYARWGDDIVRMRNQFTRPVDPVWKVFCSKIHFQSVSVKFNQSQ